jgi:hypothetical protein
MSDSGRANGWGIGVCDLNVSGKYVEELHCSELTIRDMLVNLF